MLNLFIIQYLYHSNILTAKILKLIGSLLYLTIGILGRHTIVQQGGFMGELIQIQWTSGNIDEARRVCRFLVQERHVACANIIPWVESIYMWNNQLETEQECKVILKTTRNKFEVVKEAIQNNCSYELPEISFLLVAGTTDEFSKWINESVLEESNV